MDAIFTRLAAQLQLPLQSPVLIFSLVLFIILLVPIVFERLRVPSIIGLIASGALIGPFGFDVLGKSLFVDVFSTIGLLYIMFIAGLELNLNEFRINRNKSILFGGLTFFIPIAIGFPVCYYGLHFDFYASLLVASVFATHTLVTYPIASRFGVSRDASVAVTVGGTILTDTAVLIVLAVIVGAQHDGLTQDFWIQLVVSVAVFSLFMFVVIPRFARWFFENFESDRYLHYVFVLAVAFLAAFLAEVASLEAIIGAFAAGLALNKLIPHSSVLMNRVEFMGNALFIPFFLISVGMLVDVRVFLGGTTALLISAALIVAATAGKYVAASATQLAFRYTKDQRHLIFGLSSAHAAATLAVILVGYREGIVGDEVLNAIVLIILVSCVLASFVTERAAGAIASLSNAAHDPEVIAELDMEQIIVPVADTENVGELLHFAALIKDKESTHPLAVLNVVGNTPHAESDVAAAKKKLETGLSEITGADVRVNVMATIDHNKTGAISRVSREVSANVAVLGWPQEAKPLERWIENKISTLLRYTVEALFVCHLPQTLVKHGKLFLIVPDHAQEEAGFVVWMAKVAKLSTELSLPIQLNCSRETHDAIIAYNKQHKLTLDIQFNEFSDWEDFLIVFMHMTKDDLMMVVAAGSGQASYNHYMDKLPEKLQKHFPDFNRIVVYPQ